MKLSVPIAYKEKISTKEEIFSFMAKDQEDVLVSIEDLENLKSTSSLTQIMPKLSLAERSRIRFGRYGQVISISEKAKWKLDLASRALETRVDKNISASNIIEILLFNSFTNDEFEREEFDDQTDITDEHAKNYRPDDLDFIKESLNKYVLTDLGVVNLNVADLTYHPVPAIRSLFLAIVDASFLKLDDVLNLTEIFAELDDIEFISAINNEINAHENEFEKMQKEIQTSDNPHRQLLGAASGSDGGRLHRRAKLLRDLHRVLSKHDFQKEIKDFLLGNNISFGKSWTLAKQNILRMQKSKQKTVNYRSLESRTGKLLEKHLPNLLWGQISDEQFKAVKEKYVILKKIVTKFAD